MDAHVENPNIVEENDPSDRVGFNGFYQQSPNDGFVSAGLTDNCPAESIMLGSEGVGFFGYRVPSELKIVLDDDSSWLPLGMAVDDLNLIHVRTVPDVRHIVGISLGIL